MRRAIHAFIAVQLRVGAALSTTTAEARFKAWARPRTDAVHTVTNVPDSDEARLRRYATAAPADDDAKRDAWISKRERLLAALRDEDRHAPPLQVLYEDDAMAVVLKPAGVHAMSWRNTLKRRQLCLDDVLALVLEPSRAADALPAPLPRHRLDARVAGPVAIAKSRSAHVALGRAFEQNEVDKE